jgi:mono/diheme cytochrome c family protein
MNRLHFAWCLGLLSIAAALGGCFAEPRPEPPYVPSEESVGGAGGRGGSSQGGRPASGGDSSVSGTSGRGGTGAVVPVYPEGGEGGGTGGSTVSACPDGLVTRVAPSSARCLAVRASEPLPARSVVSDANAAATDVLYYTQDLFGLFSASCGGCHVEQGLGGFRVDRGNFRTKFDAAVLDVIRHPVDYMPPGNKPFSARGPGDPVVELVRLAELWLSQGAPGDRFILPAELGGQSPYFMPLDLATNLTNIGTCRPDADLVATAQERACEVDARVRNFTKKLASESGASPAEYVGLPARLDETDLFTLDSEALARHGVIAYAPTYPLWSDNSGKLRHVRVPMGESIRFDKERQEFSIPDNTRFYKTFLRKVIDIGGEERWKKIETRLIVARAEEPLFGTYIWDEQETKAELLVDGYRDGTPFRDKVLTVVTDEPAAAAILATNPNNIIYELEQVHAVRRYAVPGRERCIQCHMGSPSGSFVLGFTPLQVWRRPQGEGGVIEPAGEDELDQLERLIDYGVITGIESSADIIPLEDSQLPRKPRNEHELTAQAYMFGNCAHCHNPRGFPSKENPELEPLLNFWPAAGGGIFEFPLETYSPRIKRGINGDIPMPYITPSIRDLTPRTGVQHTRKYDVNDTGLVTTVVHLDAPWRSLLWRAVDTPFPYADDYAIFPHMPMNTAGYDCRAPRIVGDWMVSIPAKLKHPELDENTPDPLRGYVGKPIDRTPQPWVEVKPGSSAYGKAVEKAALRLKDWRTGERYPFCADATDILDPDVVSGLCVVPEDKENVFASVVEGRDSVPERVHFFETDLTEVPPPWYPRRLDWDAVVGAQCLPCLDPNSRDLDLQRARQEAEAGVIAMLTGEPVCEHPCPTPEGTEACSACAFGGPPAAGARITPAFRTFALGEIPLGLWQKKPGCDFSSESKVESFGPPESRPAWMKNVAADAPVYTPLPGEAVFDMICANCHGVNADSKGIQSQKVAELTGGKSRVANFMEGLFGPSGDPGANRARVFPDSGGATSEDWAARYMAWMALGGTQAVIPTPVLQLVARTDVLGVPRAGFDMTASPNMLAVAQELCRFVLPNNTGRPVFGMTGGGWVYDYSETPLITAHGDADLWQKLCSIDNRPVVRALNFQIRPAPQPPVLDIYYGDAFRWGEGYGTAPVGDHRGRVVQGGITPDNVFPWCIKKPPAGTLLEQATAFATANAVDGSPLPFCPDAVVASPALTLQDFAAWTQRGAINAGFAVYLFLDKLSKGEIKRVRYNECEKLSP